MWGWRVLILNSDADLKLLNGNLHVFKSDGSVSLPIEDIDFIVVESFKGVVSYQLLRELAKRGIALLVTDRSFMPSGVFIPFVQSTNTSDLIFRQIEQKVPFKKRIWQRIIRQKILNQSFVLEYLGKPNADVLKKVHSEVKSGDSTKREAFAAKIYFQSISKDFRRFENDSINAALNYGYAIIRSTLARSLSATGLVCAIGVGHKSRTNPFNLADDFLEVFRPFVDLLVFSLPPKENQLSTEYKRYLIRVLKMECMIGSRVYTVSTASWEIAQSYARAIKNNSYVLLNLPLLNSFSFREEELV
ncbi:MAG: type II CRISPR-associated endonuclease Cas1 [Archaeoglobaceae archaeon]